MALKTSNDVEWIENEMKIWGVFYTFDVVCRYMCTLQGLKTISTWRNILFIIKYKQLAPAFSKYIHFFLKPFAKQSTSGAFLRKRHLCDIRISANSVHSALKIQKSGIGYKP